MADKLVVVAVLICLSTILPTRDCSECQEGSTWSTGPENCGSWMCEEGIAKRVRECPMYKLSSKCKILPIPEGAQYPLCCPRFECPSN